MVGYMLTRQTEGGTLTQRSSNLVMDKVKISDDEIMVDKMIAASQERRGVAVHPSFGRNLVPYFIPGAGENPMEDHINVSTDLDAFRRKGASVMEIPKPVSANGAQKYEVQSKVRRKGFSSEGDGSPAVDGERRKRRAPKKARKRMNASAESESDGLENGLLKPGIQVSPTGAEHGARVDNQRALLSSDDSMPTACRKKGSHHDVRNARRVGKPKPAVTVASAEALSKSAPSGAGTMAFKPKQLSLHGSPVLTRTTSVVGAGQQVRGFQVPDSGCSSGDDTLGGVRVFSDERWAGPAFHNSPAPSDLPLPSFSCQVNKEKQSSRGFVAEDAMFKPQSLLNSFSEAAATPIGTAGINTDVQQATLKLRELLKLHASPADELSHSAAFATTDLRKVLGLA